VPTTNPELTPPGVAMFAIKCRDAVVFSPHPRSKRTTIETVEIMRRVLAREGAPVDLLQCLERPSIPAAQYLMSQADLVQATGGRDMVKAAYSSGTPAYGVGAGNSTMVIDETADIAEAARNTRLSKLSDFGSGCSADGNLVVEASIYDALRAKLIEEGGHLATAGETELLRVALWDDEGHRTPDTIAISAQALAARAGFEVPADRRFFILEQTEIGKHNVFSSEKLGVVLSMFRFTGFENALEMVKAIYEVGGKGHSCGIYSFDDDRIDRLARIAPVAGSWSASRSPRRTPGLQQRMPMTSSLGCGTWGGNITSENIHLKHYMNVTWVSRPIAEDRPPSRSCSASSTARQSSDLTLPPRRRALAGSWTHESLPQAPIIRPPLIYVVGLFTVLILGLNWPVMSWGLATIEPLWLTLVRLLGAGAGIAVVLALTRACGCLPPGLSGGGVGGGDPAGAVYGLVMSGLLLSRPDDLGC